MKDSAGDMTFFARYVESQSDKFDVMTGHGGTFATALKLGGQGGILAVATVLTGTRARGLGIEQGRDARQTQTRRKSPSFHRQRRLSRAWECRV
jgi:hypothetical protein